MKPMVYILRFMLQKCSLMFFNTIPPHDSKVSDAKEKKKKSQNNKLLLHKHAIFRSVTLIGESDVANFLNSRLHPVCLDCCTPATAGIAPQFF